MSRSINLLPGRGIAYYIDKEVACDILRGMKEMDKGSVAVRQGGKNDAPPDKDAYEQRARRQDLNEFVVRKIGKLALRGKGIIWI